MSTVPYNKHCRLVGKYVKTLNQDIIVYDSVDEVGHDYQSLFTKLKQRAVNDGLIKDTEYCAFIGDCIITLGTVEYKLKYSFPNGLQIPEELNKNVFVCKDLKYSKDPFYNLYDRLWFIQNAVKADYYYVKKDIGACIDKDLVIKHNVYSIQFDGKLFELKTVKGIPCYVHQEGGEPVEYLYRLIGGLVYFD